MTTERDRARLNRLIGATANSVFRDPSRRASSRVGGNEEKRTAWAAGGKLITGDEQKIVSLQFTFKEPGSHCVQFNFTAPVRVVGSRLPAKCEALITWETNGNTVTRRVSVADGTTIQGIGESVKVVIYDTTLVGTLVPASVDIGREYSVTASVAPGTRGSFTNPPILCEANEAFLMPGGTGHIVEVPEDAGATSLCVTVSSTLSSGPAPIPDQMVQIELLTRADSPQTIQRYDPRDFAFVPLAPGVGSATFQNYTAFFVYVQFLWGIDG